MNGISANTAGAVLLLAIMVLAEFHSGHRRRQLIGAPKKLKDKPSLVRRHLS